MKNQIDQANTASIKPFEFTLKNGKKIAINKKENSVFLPIKSLNRSSSLMPVRVYPSYNIKNINQ